MILIIGFVILIVLGIVYFTYKNNKLTKELDQILFDLEADFDQFKRDLQ